MLKLHKQTHSMPSANIEAIRTYIVLRGIFFPITSELWSGTTEILQRDMLFARRV